eukprot:gene32272-40861_t
MDHDLFTANPVEVCTYNALDVHTTDARRCANVIRLHADFKLDMRAFFGAVTMLLVPTCPTANLNTRHQAIRALRARRFVFGAVTYTAFFSITSVYKLPGSRHLHADASTIKCSTTSSIKNDRVARYSKLYIY